MNGDIPNPPIKLSNSKSKSDYTRYADYDAINVDDIRDIPLGVLTPIGVPKSYLDRESDFFAIGLSGKEHWLTFDLITTLYWPIIVNKDGTTRKVERRIIIQRRLD